MSQAKIKTLTDDSGAIIYPKTKVEAVYGLENVNNRIDSKVPTDRTINGKSLNANITLTATDVGATSFTPISVTIATSAWSSNSATVSCSAVTATNTLIVAPAPNSYGVWGNSKIRASAQGNKTITFICDSTPAETVNVNIVALG